MAIFSCRASSRSSTPSPAQPSQRNLANPLTKYFKCSIDHSNELIRRFGAETAMLRVVASNRLVSHRALSAPLATGIKRNFSAIRKVGVVGAGQMGTGIAIVSAVNAKLNVLISDVSQKQLDGAKKFAETLVPYQCPLQ